MRSARVRVHADGIDPAHASDRTWSAEHGMIPWIAEHIDLAGARVFEYGAGDGQVSRAVAGHAASVHGVDIDADMIALGRSSLAEAGIENVRLEHHPVETIVDVLRDQAGEVDVVLLYAVVEHLSVPERVDVLSAARDAAGDDGVIVMTEAQNRLVSFDAHSSMLPYFQWLPRELQRLYVDRSQRAELHDALETARPHGEEAELDAWVRFGTGVSFHEFELVFDDLARHVVAGGYETVMFPTRPLHPGELELSRDLERQRPELGPAWSRQWLDVILTPRPMDEPPPQMRAWTFDTTESDAVTLTRWGTLAVRGSSVLRVRPDAPTRKAIVGFIGTPGEVVARLAPDGVGIAEVPTLSDVDGRVRYVEVTWDDPAAFVDVSISTLGQIVLVACEQ